MSPRIIITGAGSFIGTNYRKYSKYQDVDEVSVWGNNPEKIDFTGYSVVLHLAAIVHQSRKIPEHTYFEINRDLSLKVAEVAKKAGVCHFIYLSTVKVYGNPDKDVQTWNEDSKCIPVDAYGRSKYEAEKALLNMDDENFRVAIVRTPIVYGEGVRANMLHLIQLVKTLKLLPFKNVGNKRYYSATENLIAYIDRIIEKRKPGIFIAMDSSPMSTTELVAEIAKAMNRKIILFKLPEPVIKFGKLVFPKYFHPLFGSLILDNSKTREILDFQPLYSVRESIVKMINYYLNETNDLSES